MDSLEVHRVGSIVMVGDTIKAVVSAVCIRGNGVSYEVSWWNGPVYYTTWLSSFEVSPVQQDDMTRIGFHAITGGSRVHSK